MKEILHRILVSLLHSQLAMHVKNIPVIVRTNGKTLFSNNYQYMIDCAYMHPEVNG